MTITEQMNDVGGYFYSFVFSEDGRIGSSYQRKDGLIGDDYKYVRYFQE